MFNFDITKIWYSMCSRRYIQLSSKDVNLLSEKVLGGILRKWVPINLSEVVKCMYDVVIIKDRPCVLISLLGEGAYGKVYSAWDIKAGKKVAVKCQPAYLSDVIYKQAAITKENGIGLFDVNSNIGPSFLSDKNGYFILPLADSCFHDWVAKKAVLGQHTVIIRALIKIARDLQALHLHGKVHMDLKTDNVLIINDVAYISDFGKTERREELITSASGDFKKYPQCAPEYFTVVSHKSHYEVSSRFDLYSYGYLIKTVSRMVKDPNMKKELENIASNVHRTEPTSRRTLETVITYLEKLTS